MKKTKTMKSSSTTTATKAKPKKKGRGGRVKGVWKTGLSGDVMRQFRKDHKVSRGKMAKMLGVSSTTIQNWEVGVAVPTPKNQAELERVLKGEKIQKNGQKPKATNGTVSQAPFAHDDHHGVELSITGQIVSAWLGSPRIKGNVSQDDLVGLVRSVRSALI